MKTTVLALLACAALAVGCGDSGGTTASGSGSAKPTASGAASAKPGDSAKPEAAGGSKTCDEYWTKLKACNDKAMADAPDAAKEQMKKGFEDAEKMTKEGWKDMQGPALDSACKMMLDALANNPACPK